MSRERLRIPLFPIIPLVFPLGVFLSLMGLMTWFSYMTWKDLEAIRHGDWSRRV